MKARTILIIVGMLAGLLLVSHGFYVAGYQEGYVNGLIDARDIIADVFSKYGEQYEKDTQTPQKPPKLLPNKEFRFEEQQLD